MTLAQKIVPQAADSSEIVSVNYSGATQPA